MGTETTPLPKIAEIVEFFCRNFGYIDSKDFSDEDAKSEDAFKKKLKRLGDGPELDISRVFEFTEPRLRVLSESDPEFTKILKSEFSEFLEVYRELVLFIDCAGFSRKQILPILQDRVFLPQAAYSLRRIADLSTSPEFAKWGQGKERATASVLKWWLGKNRLKPPSFAKELEENGKRWVEKESIESSLYSWLKGNPLNIRSIFSFYDGKNQELAKWLLIANVWGVFWDTVSGGERDRFSRIWQDHLLSEPAEPDFYALHNITLEHTIQEYPHYIESRNLIHTKFLDNHLFSTTSRKSTGDDLRANDIISKLESGLQDKKPIPELAWMFDHFRAKYHILMAEPKQALKSCTRAFEGAQYRHGPAAKEILGDLLIIAAYLKDKKIIKKWTAWAVAFGLEPNIRHPVDAYVQRFPISSYYQEANEKSKTRIQKQRYKRMNQTVINIGKWENRPADLQNPNRWISGYGSEKKTQLMIYAAFGKPKKIRKLLEVKADPNLIAKDGGTAIMCAVQANEKKCFDLLLPHTNQKALDSVTRSKRISALGEAVDKGKAYYLERLLKKGADTEVKVWFGPEMTPLYLAVQSCGQLDLNTFDPLSDGVMEATINSMPLQLAPAGHAYILDQHDAMRGRLLNAMNDPQARAGFEDKVKKTLGTPGQGIDPAIRLDVVKTLLKHGANPNARHENGFTPFLYAAELGLWDAFVWMRECGGDIRSITKPYNQTVLHLTLWKGHFDFSLQLLRNASVEDRQFLISQPASDGSLPIDCFQRRAKRNGDSVENELWKMLRGT